MPVTGSERNDRVSVRGYVKTKRITPVIGYIQNSREVMPVTGS